MWCKLEDIAYIGTGATPNRLNKEYYNNGNIPWINSSSTNYTNIVEASEYITEKAINETNCKIYPIGTLIVAMYGEGKTRGQVSELLIEAATNQACAAILPIDVNTKAYLRCFFDSNYFHLRKLAEGGNQPNLSIGKISNYAIPLPPLQEQSRIVAEIREWLSLIDKIENNKESLQITIQQAKSRILDIAIHGKLVPQDPNDEPALELLKRINPDFTPCDNGHSEKLPQGWSITELTNLADIKNGYAFKSSNYISSNGVRLIRIANVQDGYIEDKMPQFYPFDKMKALKDFMLTEGDILMSLTGNVGRVGILTNELLPAALNQRVACIKEHPNIIAKKFLFYTFQTSNFSKDCVKSGKGVAQLNISTEWLKHYFILIPPLTEQQRIVQKIEELFSVLDNIQNALEV